MKKLFIYALLLSLFAACKNNSKNENGNTDDDKTEKAPEKK